MANNPKFNFIYIYLILFALTTSCAGVKQVSVKTEQKIAIQSALFEIDNLNNLYIVSNQNELSKWSDKGTLLYKFSDNRLGNIGVLDASNPLQTLVYYPDFRWLRFFDRTLNLTHELSLVEAGFQNVNALCSSNDNNIWFFDEIDQVILKIDQEGKVLLRSDDLRQVLKKSIFPSLLLERKNKLLLYDQETIYTFDVFGTFLNELNIGKCRSMVFNGKYCQYLNKENKYVRMDALSKEAVSELIKQMDASILDYRKSLDSQFFRKKDHILIKNGIE